jgi:hypothetical protein
MIQVSTNRLNSLVLLTASVATGLMFAQATPAGAVSLAIPSTTVPGTASAGSSFTVTSAFAATDTISFNASGTVSYAPSPNTYVTNAAGVFTQPSTFGFATGTAGPGTPTIGSLLVSSSATPGVEYQLFQPTAANGLGSAAPSTSLSFTNVSIGSIFGGNGLASGTVLTFRANDPGDYSDNLGAYTISGSLDNASTTVPEPFTIIGTLVGGGAALRMKKKLKQATK